MQLNRRDMIRASGAAFAPLVLPNSVCLGNGLAPSERVSVALIGCGMRGDQLIADIPDSIRIVAVADAMLPRAEMMAKRLERSIRVVHDYRHLMDDRSLDAVIVCAPDHHHVHAAVLACQAGLDVYVEKPLSTYVREGRLLVEAARRHQRVVQVGSQQRSMAINRYGCELVRDGDLGRMIRVEAVDFDGGRSYPEEGLPIEAIPKGLDWNGWQGPAAELPFNHQLTRHWSEGYPWWGDWWRHAGGRMTGLGSHALDMIQYALGKDRTTPTSIDVRHEGDQRSVAFRYEDGPEVVLSFADKRPYRGPRNGAVFVGTNGKVEINRNKIVANPSDLVAHAPKPSSAVMRDRNSARDHLQNWVDCIRTRDVPNADVEVGHCTATLCHLLNIAKRLDRSLRWDPSTEQFLNDDKANELLDRPRRRGWELSGE